MRNSFDGKDEMSPILLLTGGSIPPGQMLANAAKRSYLERADLELGLFDRAPRF